MPDARLIASLLEERRGYVMRKLPDRIAAVDARLAMLGYYETETATLDAAAETATRKKPTRRKKG